MKALIKSRPVSFRRAGIEFNRAGREIDLGALTKDQVAAIYAEPNLEVTLLELPKKAAKVPEGPKPHVAEVPTGGKPPVGSGIQGADGAISIPGSAAPAAKPVKPAKAKATP